MVKTSQVLSAFVQTHHQPMQRETVSPTNKTATRFGWLSSHFCVSETLDGLGAVSHPVPLQAAVCFRQ